MSTDTATFGVGVPPLAPKACKSSVEAFQKLPGGMICETKYDGSRIQIHKKGDDIRCMTRRLFPIHPSAIEGLIPHIQEAFKGDIIVDGEILIESESGMPKHFSALGKKNTVARCVIFDCLSIGGESLLDLPLPGRKARLREAYTPNDIIEIIKWDYLRTKEELDARIDKMVEENQEGIVVKSTVDAYVPGKWFKIKREYLPAKTMSDSLDLIVLGAWTDEIEPRTPDKMPTLSKFLMGCYDEHSDSFFAVTRVVDGLDEPTLKVLNTTLQMVPFEAVPENLHTAYNPDFIAIDFKQQPVWEITGLDLTTDMRHTAGIYIRKPRVLKVRTDKTWEEATPLSAILEMVKSASTP